MNSCNEKLEKEILKEILKIEIEREFGERKISDKKKELEKKISFLYEKHGGIIRKLSEKGYISEQRITHAGRKKIKVVLCGGVFDIIHAGHIYMLSEAKALGDFLAVVVARDSTVKKRKRIPIISEEERIKIVNSLKPVDIAFLGDEKDYYRVLSVVKPSIVALGYDQEHDEEEIRREARKRGIEVEIARIGKYNAKLASTREIINRIIKEYKK